MSDDEAEENSNISVLLAAVDRGEPGALDELVAAVHEAFVRLASGDGKWNDRGHFLRAASTVMRHLLVDHARKKRAEKRGAGQAPLTLEDDRYATEDDSLAVLALDNALKDIAEIDPRLEQIIECRYFAGLSVNDTAEALGMAVRTVERDWQRAKAYLLKAMDANAH
jgi:RNA polymerase sigma factor (TIGR02999 family)